MKKTIAYIDGYNLYRGLTDNRNEISLRQYLWLKLDDFISSYIIPNGCELVRIKYFTAAIKDDIERHERQDAYIRALRTIPNLKILMGKFMKDPHGNYKEKKTDVSIGLHVYSDALSGKYDAIVLLSGDTDQVPTLEFLHTLDHRPEIHLITPPHRSSNELAKLSDFTYQIGHRALSQCQFNSTLNGNNSKIRKPPEWT